jgi:hypothetical protein
VQVQFTADGVNQLGLPESKFSPSKNVTIMCVRESMSL